MDEPASFTRIALAAAPIFLAHGYAAVSLRVLADQIGIKAASLYYHCPAGKAELYARSLALFLDEYRRGLEAASGRAKFPRALFRMADWMVEHPPVDLPRVLRVDLPHLEDAATTTLVERLHEAVLAPIAGVLESGQQGRRVRAGINIGIAAASVVALVQGLGFSHLPSDRSPTRGEIDSAKRTVSAGLTLLLEGIEVG